MINKHGLIKFEKDFINSLKKCTTLQEIDLLFRKKLGNKGEITKLIRDTISSTSIEEKKIIMPEINLLKQNLIKNLNEKKRSIHLKKIKQELKAKKVYLGELKESPKSGYLHPNKILIEKITTILQNEDFIETNDSPVELSEYNFFRLNVGKTHPAFTSSDTFFLNAKRSLLLRAHCTSSTARMLEKNKNKEFSSFSIGNVFRRDTDDTTHTHQFIQLDVVKVISNSNIWEFKLFLESFLKKLLGEQTKVRFRPNYFPFTSPSFELDVQCPLKDKDCLICKNTGWIEILGAGMLHIDIFKKAGFSMDYINKNKIVGWAFGMGIDRLTCILHKIPDTRMLYENKKSFLKYFKTGL